MEYSNKIINKNNKYVICIYGGSNSGKTTISNIIKNLYPNNSLVISQDCFYKNGNDNTNFDNPNSIDFSLLEHCITELIYNKKTYIPIYDFSIHTRTNKKTLYLPKDIIIIEGTLIMNNKLIRELCNLKIFVNADLDTMYNRKCIRDKIKRNRSQEQIDIQWNRDVKKMYLKHIYPKKDIADIIINNVKNLSELENLDLIKHKISYYLDNK